MAPQARRVHTKATRTLATHGAASSMLSTSTATEVLLSSSESRKRKSRIAEKDEEDSKLIITEAHGLSKSIKLQKSNDLAPAKRMKRDSHRKSLKAATPADAGDTDVNGALPVINYAPTDVLVVLAFGTGEIAGELGMGSRRKEAARAIPILRLDPRSPDSYRVVQLACGGMHTIALTDDNKIVTWGNNDKGALGRDTSWDGGLRDISADNDNNDDSDSGDEPLNMLESTPTHIPEQWLPQHVKFTCVNAGDSCSFAVTDTGLVYGWGTFLDSEAHEMFIQAGKTRVQRCDTPMLIPGLSNIKSVVCGANHALALDGSGKVWSWGVNEQQQLGRSRRAFRDDDGQKMADFYPSRLEMSSKPIKHIACGQYHSFAIDQLDRVYSWGQNTFAQTGSPHNAGQNRATLDYPTRITTLSKRNITFLDGGEFHSLAITGDGRCLVWGRLDGGQLGIELSQEELDDPKVTRRDEYGRPGIVLQPVQVSDVGHVVHASCSSRHTIFVNQEAKTFSCGYANGFKLGNGSEDDDVEVASEIKAKALRELKGLTWCGTGGQFSMVAGLPVASDAE